MFLTVTQFAEKRNVTGRYVRKLIQTGKITRKSWKMQGKQYRIDPVKAGKDLSENLDRIYNPVRPSDELEQFPDPDQTDRLEIQDQAADVACEGEEFFPGGYTHPWAIWAARYVGELFLLSPDRVTIERISKTEWRLRVDDIDDEDFEPCPWAVTMTFDFDPNLVDG